MIYRIVMTVVTGLILTIAFVTYFEDALSSLEWWWRCLIGFSFGYLFGGFILQRIAWIVDEYQEES